MARAKRISENVVKKMIVDAVTAVEQQQKYWKPVIKRTTTVNGNSETTYNGLPSYGEAMRAIYGTQGKFYEVKYGVCYDNADKAGWHPNDNNFANSCDGFQKARREKFVITRTITDEIVTE